MSLAVFEIRRAIIFGGAPKDGFEISAPVVNADDGHDLRFGVYKKRNHGTATVVCDTQTR